VALGSEYKALVPALSSDNEVQEFGKILSGMGSLGNAAVARLANDYAKIGKGVSGGCSRVSTDVSKGAGDRAKELHSVLDSRAQRMRTTTVTETKEGIRVASSSNNRLSPAQRAQLGKNEIEGIGVNAARNAGLTSTGTAASRPIYSNCAGFLKDQGVDPLSPLK